MILHLTDTHFGTERPEVMRALIDLAAQQKPSLIILSGDITQRARRSQFSAARAFIDALAAAAGLDARADVLAVPGNHDLPLFNLLARVFNPYGHYRRAFGDDLEPVLARPGLLLLGVNTTRARRHKDGEVSPAQIDRVASRLAAAPAGTLRIVVTHQPVHVLADSERKNLLHGHQAAIKAWSAAGADLLLGGHIHQSFVTPLAPAYPALPHDTWVVQTGTAVSTRTRDGIPNSVHVIVVAPGATARCSVQRWDYAAENGIGRFRLVGETIVPITRRA